MRFSKENFSHEFTKNQSNDEEIHQNILEGMNVYGSNFIILICAIIIASIGLNMNASAVIIGAMLVSPLMGSVIGIGYGVGTYNIKILKEAFKILLLSIVISITTSTLYFSITPITTAGSEILARTSPTIWDVIIAFVGGIAGMIGITRNKSSNVIPGVAIATALMPPLCTAGYGLATQNYSIFLGAGYLFFINCFFIAISTFIVTKSLRLPVRTTLDDEKQKKVKTYIILTSIVVMIPSMFSALKMINKTIQENSLNSFINNELEDHYIIDKEINTSNNTLSLAVVGDKISDKDIDNLQGSLEQYDLEYLSLVITQDESNISDLDKYINELKNQNNTFIKNNTIVDEPETTISEDNTVDVDEISKELKVIYPTIEQVFAGFITSENNLDTEIPTLLLYSDDDELINNLDTIEKWAKIKYECDDVKVFIQKPIIKEDIQTDDEITIDSLNETSTEENTVSQ